MCRHDISGSRDPDEPARCPAGWTFCTCQILNDETTMTEQTAPMDRRQGDTVFRNGVLAGSLLMIGSSAVHWMITPAAHPAASTLDWVGNAVQLLAGVGGALLLTYRHSRRVASSRSDG